jgi:peptidoglycan/LPS O-acetylase OafA/YrhL
MKPVLLPLTSFRFFAAAAVVMCHRPHTPNDLLPYEWHGHAGVAFFFLLSGFILTYTYHDRFVTRQPRATRDFLVARLARIFPAYLLAFLLTLWLCDMGQQLLTLRLGNALWPALAHLTMAQALVPKMSFYYAFNPPAWSLSCEWFFYLTFPLLLLGLATGSLWRRAAVFAAASAVWVGVLVTYLATPGDPGAGYYQWNWAVYVFPLTRVFDFACGVVLGVLFVRRRPEIGPARGARYWAWGLVELGALGALWATLHFCPINGAAGSAEKFRVQMLAGLGYYLPSFACLVWVGALGRGPLSRVLSWSPLVYLGELSYGVYIFHIPVFSWVAWGSVRARFDAMRYLHELVAFAFLATLAVSALSYHFWETPIRRLVRGRASRPVTEESVGAARPLPPPERRAA